VRRLFARGVLVFVTGCGGDDATATSGSEDGTEAEGSASEGSTAASTTATTGTTDNGESTSARSDTSSAGSGAMETGDPCNCMAGGYAPMCGVDGMTYDAICGIECVPVEIECEGECPCSSLECGPMSCAATDAVCTVTHGGPAGSRPSYVCSTLPGDCGPDPDCTCFPKIGCTCAEDPEDHFTIECFAP
jgi:hypothetical protein